MAEDQKTIGVTDFKAHRVALIDEVAQGRMVLVVTTERNRPVTGGEALDGDRRDPWGALRGSVVIEPGVDLTQGVCEEWDAGSL